MKLGSHEGELIIVIEVKQSGLDLGMATSAGRAGHLLGSANVWRRRASVCRS